MPAMTSGLRIDQKYPRADVEYRTRRSRTVSNQSDRRYRAMGERWGRTTSIADTRSIVCGSDDRADRACRDLTNESSAGEVSTGSTHGSHEQVRALQVFGEVDLDRVQVGD